MAITDYQGNVTFKGAVLAEYERNGYDDSDFYAIVWDAELGVVHSIEYGTTRFAGCGSAQVDATPESYRAAYEFTLARRIESAQEMNVNFSSMLGKGKRVAFSGNRRKGIKDGDQGVVFWTSVEKDYTNRFDVIKIGVVLDNGSRVFTSVGAHDNTATVKVIGAEKYQLTEQQVEDVVRQQMGEFNPSTHNDGFFKSNYHYMGNGFMGSALTNIHTVVTRNGYLRYAVAADAPEYLGEYIPAATAPTETRVIARAVKVGREFAVTLNTEDETILSTGYAKSVKGAVYQAFSDIKKKFGVKYIYPEVPELEG